MLTLLTLTSMFHFQVEVLFGIKQQKTLQNSIQTHTTQNWKGTGTYIYTDCYSVLMYPALRCNLDVLMEKISTLFNYILSLPMLLQITNVPTRTMFLISNFCRVLYVVCFLLGNSPPSEFYMPTFRNTLSVPSA